MIRVCHVITQLELGGAQKVALHTASHLDRSRFAAEVAAGPGGMLDEDARSLGIPFHTVRSLRREVSLAGDMAALAELTRLLRRLRPDIVHTHSSKAGILGRWAAMLAGVPHTVHSIHGYGFHPGQAPARRWLFVSLERLTGRHATSVFVTVSRANLQAGLDLELFPPPRAALIHYGVRLGDFRPADRNGAAGRPLVVGMIGCLKPQKAPLDFVAVAARVLKAPDAPAGARFVLVGDGVLRPDVERAIALEGLQERVILAGWRRDIPELLRGFDLLLHTSRWEGLPIAFLEAMATGLPIVATRVDGAPDAVEDGVTGYLLDSGDVEGLARRTAELLRDGALRRSMGAEALRRSAAWDIDGMVGRQERLYEALVREGPARAVAQSTQIEPGA
ncbi:MAG TPA: glycosyltransferase family 4 protein [Candidatus Polarisedimenticolia bacterium]|nr:glycosyltransferase family 4 protein [Candidatus Polarisedimenticolia bacterium]